MSSYRRGKFTFGDYPTAVGSATSAYHSGRVYTVVEKNCYGFFWNSIEYDCKKVLLMMKASTHYK